MDPKWLINPRITNYMPHLSVGRIQVLVPLVLRTQYGFGFEDNTPNCQRLVSGTTSSHINVLICKIYHICCVQTDWEFVSALTAEEPLAQISESNKIHTILPIPHPNRELTYIYFVLSVVGNLHRYVTTITDKTEGVSVSNMSLF